MVLLLSLRLVNAPAIEAIDIVEKLIVRDEKTIRMTLFSLQKFIKVKPISESVRCADLELNTSFSLACRKSCQPLSSNDDGVR